MKDVALFALRQTLNLVSQTINYVSSSLGEKTRDDLYEVADKLEAIMREVRAMKGKGETL